VSGPRSVGRYEILREVGRGGMAVVYLARQSDLDRLVALKELSALAAADATTARRFLRESRLAGSLNHPNIVTVHDFFEHHATPYIAMEYLDRGSLRPLIGSLSFAQVAGVVEGLLAGLRHAHERGIVHRDVKPENLMISDEARVKIADFGIAKATDEAQAGTFLTATGTTIGTPTYMAPEQAMGEHVGPWTDLYAVGIIAFELLSGRPPFDASGTPMAVLLRHVNERPLTLSAVRPSADPRLSGWIDALLATDSRERTQSAATAWMAFEEIVLDHLGSRWRHSAALEATGAIRTPTTMRLAGVTDRDDRSLATIMPAARRERAAGSASGGSAVRMGPAAAAFAGLPAAGAAMAGRAGRRPVRRAAGLARLLVLVAGFAIAIAAGLSLAQGDEPRRAGAAGQQRQQPAGENRRGQRERAPAAGVGDSQSDDPSDDEEDGPEP